MIVAASCQIVHPYQRNSATQREGSATQDRICYPVDWVPSSTAALPASNPNERATAPPMDGSASKLPSGGTNTGVVVGAVVGLFVVILLVVLGAVM